MTSKMSKPFELEKAEQCAQLQEPVLLSQGNCPHWCSIDILFFEREEKSVDTRYFYHSLLLTLNIAVQ